MNCLSLLDATPNPWQVVSWQVAAIGGLIAAFLGLVQWSAAVRQRARELRWKQAELARSLTDEWFDWPPSNNALVLIDEGYGTYSLEGLGSLVLTPHVDIPHAFALKRTAGELRADHSDERAIFVRKCFDSLFYYLERTEHSVDIGVARLEDFRAPANYYVKRLAPYRQWVEPYLDFVGYTRAKVFLERFVEWRNSATQTRSISR